MNACDAGTHSRWREAEQALRLIVPAVCHANPEGSTLYIFSSQYEVVPGCKSAADVDRVFRQHSPGGTTNLRPVLTALVGAHRQSYARDGRPTSVLVIHDGEPNEPDAVRQQLADTANAVSSDYELFFSFIQCGQDDGATRFLEVLDSGLNAQHDIVDTLKFSLLEKKGFAGTIQSLLPPAPEPDPVKVAAPAPAPTVAVESRKTGLPNPAAMIRATRTTTVRRTEADQLGLQFFQFIRERAHPGGPLESMRGGGR